MLGSPQFLDSSSPTPSNTNIWSKNNNNDTLLTTPSTSTTSTTYTPTTTISNLGDPVLFSPTFQQQQQQQQQDHQTLDSITKMDQSPKSNITLTPPCSTKKQQHRHSSISIGYANASKPFSYADGYHYLINYVRQK